MKYFSIISAAALAVISTNQAHALSCLPTGFDATLQAEANVKNNLERTYVLGKFSGYKIPKKQPRKKQASSNGNQQIIQIIPAPKAFKTKASFSGVAITSSGERKFKQNVMIHADCAASWCGKIPTPGTRMIAILEKTSTGYQLNSGPCQFNTYESNLKATWKKLKRQLQ